MCLNNSPSEVARIDMAGREVIHTTHAGTEGLMAATRAEVVLTGALVNCAATIAYIQSLAPQVVSIVRMGEHAISRCDGDDLCAELFLARLRGLPFDVASIRKRLRAALSAQRFFDSAVEGSPQADFDLCTATDCFDFALRLDRTSAPARLNACRAGSTI
jgi:2-phosphosulfolactate phosphatase